MAITLSHNNFFFNLGTVDRLTKVESLPLHQAYVAGTPEQRIDLFKRAVLFYVMGKLDMSEAKAVKLIALKRVERSATDERVVNAAGAKARDHLVRGFKEGHSKSEPVVVVSQAKVDAAIEIAKGMTKAEFTAWLSAVRAAVVFE